MSLFNGERPTVAEHVWTDCVNDGKYVPADLCNFLGRTQLVKQVQLIIGYMKLSLGLKKLV